MVSDFSLLDSVGHIHRLSDFRGNIVFLNFWATWCPPCVQEFPLMEALNQRFKAKNFTMLGITVDRSWRDVESFLTSLSREPSFLLLLDADKRISGGYGTDKYPETYIIGTDGRLLKRYIGAYDWTDPRILAELEEYF